MALTELKDTDLENTIGVHAYLQNHQAIVTGTWTLIVYDQTYVNAGGHYDTSTGLFTCPLPGKYYIYNSCLIIDSSSGKTIYNMIRVNATNAGGVGKYNPTTTNYEHQCEGARILDLDAGDTIGGLGYHNHGSNRNYWDLYDTGFIVIYLGR